MTPDAIYEGIVTESFAKAEENYVNNKKYKLSELISESIEETSKIKITRKTFVNYYNKYIEKKDGIATPKHENIELLCQYLGYNSYRDYITKRYGELKNKDSYETTKINALPSLTIQTPKNKTLIHALLTLILIGIGWISHSLFQSEQGSRCMIWVEDHYEEVACPYQRKEQTVDNNAFKSVKQLSHKAKKRNSFFLPYEDSIVWYDQHKNIFTFFTKEELSLESSVITRPIDSYVINRHLQECEFY